MIAEYSTVVGATPFSAIASAINTAKFGGWSLRREPYPVGGLFGTRVLASHWAVDLWRLPWDVKTPALRTADEHFE